MIGKISEKQPPEVFKVAGLLACNFFKKRLQHGCVPINIAKFLRTPILKNICERLLLASTMSKKKN